MRSKPSVQPTEFAIQEGQRCLKAFPLIVLGSGASIPYGLPSMGDLANSLKKLKFDNKLSDVEQNQWKRFIGLLASKDLESALQENELSEPLFDRVVQDTWVQVCQKDTEVFAEIIDNNIILNLIKLYKYLFKSTNKILSVVTPNYDRLAEYASDMAGFSHFKGFGYGYVRQWSFERQQIPKHYQRLSSRMINIWKVHGCLDWFIDPNNNVVAITSAKEIPPNCRPAIVTPGIKKYLQTHLEPFRTIISSADEVLSKANAFLCIGFGFNDTHICPKLIGRWQKNDVLLVMLTKKLSESAKQMLQDAKDAPYLAFEESKTGTFMLSNNYPKGEMLPNIDLWSLKGFLENTIDYKGV
ncbi:MAG: SIR2 family protein [Magnetococcales bacterium]|nr:SIR2 family protein [Magnetococcales bacterium]